MRHCVCQHSAQVEGLSVWPTCSGQGIVPIIPNNLDAGPANPVFPIISPLPAARIGKL